MALFASLAAADLRCTAKGPAGDNTWLYAHSAYATMTAQACCRIVRKETSALALTEASWIEITDDATV